MIKIKNKITNPMTVIAIFAFISESSAALSLPFLDNDEREIYIWFLISFPFYLLLLFFMTLNFNYRSLYAPSDFDKDDSFLKIVDELNRTGDSVYPSAAETPNTSWIEHTIQLPKRFGTLCAIDVRPMINAQAFSKLAEHLPRLGKHSVRPIVFLTDPASEILLRQMMRSFFKQSKKSARGALFIAYNVSTQSTTELGEV
ncbi:hypothetical protein ACXR0M_14130 [Pseudomonas sp. Eth.TT006]